jgi:hypothetical protein
MSREKLSLAPLWGEAVRLASSPLLDVPPKLCGLGAYFSSADPGAICELYLVGFMFPMVVRWPSAREAAQAGLLAADNMPTMIL